MGDYTFNIDTSGMGNIGISNQFGSFAIRSSWTENLTTSTNYAGSNYRKGARPSVSTTMAGMSVRAGRNTRPTVSTKFASGRILHGEEMFSRTHTKMAGINIDINPASIKRILAGRIRVTVNTRYAGMGVWRLNNKKRMVAQQRQRKINEAEQEIPAKVAEGKKPVVHSPKDFQRNVNDIISALEMASKKLIMDFMRDKKKDVDTLTAELQSLVRVSAHTIKTLAADGKPISTLADAKALNMIGVTLDRFARIASYANNVRDTGARTAELNRRVIANANTLRLMGEGIVRFFNIEESIFGENGTLLERRVTTAMESCEDCISYEVEGWTPVGTLPALGDSECATNCKCYFEYKPTDKDSST